MVIVRAYFSSLDESFEGRVIGSIHPPDTANGKYLPMRAWSPWASEGLLSVRNCWHLCCSSTDFEKIFDDFDVSEFDHSNVKIVIGNGWSSRRHGWSRLRKDITKRWNCKWLREILIFTLFALFDRLIECQERRPIGWRRVQLMLVKRHWTMMFNNGAKRFSERKPPWSNRIQR